MVPSASRELIESVVRSRVAALDAVRVREGAEAVGLLGDGALVRGVRVRDRAGGTEEITADLVVEAVFSLVEELFDPAEVDDAFHELVRLVEDLADGSAWDRTVALPEARGAGGDGLRLGWLDTARGEVVAGPPRDDTERLIAHVWEDGLQVPVLDRGTDFFQLGGDSLLAVRAIARLVKETGVTLGVRDFLDAPTVAGVRAALGETR